MKIVTSIDELRRTTHGRVVLVPTMGAFHEGHLSLMREARRIGDYVVVSLFVNPTQFRPNEDFDNYPRNVESDAAMAERVGVDLLFTPTVDTMYPRRTTTVHVDEVTTYYEGASRPGHFSGVATVVLKLFNIVKPNDAIFGRKDLQQCAVINRMVEDLNVDIGLHFQDTYREDDGLAMSSRNRYLSPEERLIAPVLYRLLCEARDEVRQLGLDKIATFPIIQASYVARLSHAGFTPDYFDLIDFRNLAPATSCSTEVYIAVAARLGKTRLIDNIQVFPH